MGLVLIVAGRAEAESPTGDMQAYTERVLQLIQDTVLREKDTIEALQAAVRKVTIQVFGAPEAAEGALGRHWEELTPAERDDFVQLFAEFLEAIYISRMDSEGGLRVRYVGELVEGDRADVRARVFTKKGHEMTVDARLVHRDGRWLVYDIAVERVSLVSNYRSQFDRVIRKSGYAELVRLIRVKRDELLRSKRAAAN
jgi:phospholipid transport system substrate-binding protein